MSLHRGVVAAAAVLLVASLSACGFADDNYTNAEKALENSRPNLTVPASVTTMAPFQTLPGDETGGSLPVELATPEQRAAAVAEAQQRAEDRKAGRVPGRPGAPGAGVPSTASTAPTTTTVPVTPACTASRRLQVVGNMLVLSPRDSLASQRDAVAALAGVWREVQAAVPPANRPLVDGVVLAYLEIEQRALTATTSAQLRGELTGFLRSQSREITKVLTVLTSLCPQVIDTGQDQAESIDLGV